jgi:hypothetical protein
MGRIEDLEEGRALVKKSCTLKSYEPQDTLKQISRPYERFLSLKSNL